MGCASQVEHSRDHGEAVYFAYDGLMRKRIERDFAWNGGGWAQTNEILYVYDGNLVLQERDGHDEPLTTYTRGIDLSGTLDGAGGIGGLLARSDNQRIVPAILCPEHPNPQNVVTSYYFSDAQGNVVQLFAPNGMILAQYEYDPFGNLISKNGLMADMNKYRFSSKEWEGNAGIYYYGYRFYDPDLQRWVNRDPNGEPGFEAMQLYSTDNSDSWGWAALPLPIDGPPTELEEALVALGLEWGSELTGDIPDNSDVPLIARAENKYQPSPSVAGTLLRQDISTKHCWQWW